MAIIGADMYAEDGLGTSEPGGGTADPDTKLLAGDDDKKAAAAALAIWQAKDSINSRREAQWRVNELRRAGLKEVHLRRRGGDDWIAYVPPYLETSPDILQTMNAAANQCRKFSSILLTDPPAPDPVPETGSDEDRDAAEVAGRILSDQQSETKMNDQRLIRRAFDKSSTYGSGFIWYYVDPRAGGRAPAKISAGFDPATGRTATNQNDLLDDPATGLPWSDYREAYLDPNGNVTLDPKAARQDWLPGLAGRVFSGRSIRMIPHDAMSPQEADGVQIGYFVTLGKLRSLYPEQTKNLDKDEIDKLLAFRPTRSEWLVDSQERRNLSDWGEDDNNALVWCLVTYLKANEGIEDGLYCVTAGDQLRLVNEVWSAETDYGRLSLPLPVTQYAQWAEGDDDPYRHGLMEILGPGQEIRAQVITQWMEHLVRLNNRKVFIPMHSPLKERDMKLPSATYLRTIPGTEPKYEEVPAFPPDNYRLMDLAESDMRQASSLTEIAAGMESPQVQSGRHAQAIISQVHAALSEIRQNIIDGYLNGCRIQLALIKAFFDREQRIGWVGEDGAYKERNWSRSSLRLTSDIRLKPGTLTMLSPVAKAQLAEHVFSLGVITNLELREITAGNLGAMIGLQDDVFLTRVRRQIAAWLEGPPRGWVPQYRRTQVMGPDGVTPQEQAVQILDPVLLGIWRPYPQDDLPHVSLLRLREISKAMSRSNYAVQKPEWQFGINSEFQRALVASQGTPGQQPGQPPAQMVSPAQKTQGPMAPPAIPLPSDTPGPVGQALQ